MQLRYYQQEAIDSLFAFFYAHKEGNPLLCLPTGTGKSVVIAHFLARVYSDYSNQRVLMLTHQKQLIKQNLKAFLKVWPLAPVGVFCAGLKSKDHTMPITFASIQSVSEKASWFGNIDLVVIDEAHLVSPKDATRYAKFLSALKKVNPRLRVIGLTATPYRADGPILGHEDSLFTHTAYDCTQKEAFNRLIEEGYLAPLVSKHTTAEISTAGVKTSHGDFNVSALEAKILADTPNIIRAVDETIAEGAGRKHWLVFAVSIKHADLIAAQFQARGVAACVVHSEQDSAANEKALDDFMHGRVRACVNVGCLTTGFDFPAIDLIALMRPTRACVLYVQMCGRGTRPAQGKIDCLVLDFGRVIETLGPINDPVLPRRGKGPADCDQCATFRALKQDNGLPVHDRCPACDKRFMVPVKDCPDCGYYCATSATMCPKCGHEFPRETKIEKSAAENVAIIAGNTPTVSQFAVDAINLTAHEKNGYVNLRVTYHCGLRLVDEYMCCEHPRGSGGHIWAHRWFAQHIDVATVTDYPLPYPFADAIDMAKKARFPIAIECIKRGANWQITKKVFGEKQPPIVQSRQPMKLGGSV